MIEWTQKIQIFCFASSFIEQHFGGAFDVEMKCAEAPDEAPKKTTENFLQLSCFISQEVKYMHSGLKSVNKHFNFQKDLMSNEI